jgi:hypothetical protein
MRCLRYAEMFVCVGRKELNTEQDPLSRCEGSGQYMAQVCDTAIGSRTTDRSRSTVVRIGEL